MRRLAVIIICVVITAGALILGILSVKRTNEVRQKEDLPDTIVKLRDEVKAQREKNEQLKQEIVDFPRYLGWRNLSTGTTERFPTGSVNHEQMQAYLSDWSDELKRTLGVGGYKRWDAKSGAGENLTITKLLEVLKSKEDEFRAKIVQLEGEIKSCGEEVKKVISATETETKQLNQQIDGGVGPGDAASGLIGDLIKLEKEFNALQKAHNEELIGLEEEAIAKQAEVTKIKNENVRKRESLEAAKAELRKRIYTIEFGREQAEELREPDGLILQVSNDLQTCHIDLLRSDRLFNGTRFYVYELTKGGVKVDKGEVEVIEVRERNSSICRILATFDPDWPLRVGDRIFNPIYEGAKARYIAFAGHFTGKLSNEEAIRAVRRFGDIYQAKVDEKTNYVVVAEGYENDPNFKAAEEMGVKIILEKYLYDYLGVR
jgi:hypothetical protein